MSEDTVTITIKGIPHYFKGDELTSPEQQAILFLTEVSKSNQEF